MIPNNNLLKTILLLLLGLPIHWFIFQVKPVRDSMTEALQAWTNITGQIKNVVSGDAKGMCIEVQLFNTAIFIKFPYLMTLVVLFGGEYYCRF